MCEKSERVFIAEAKDPNTISRLNVYKSSKEKAPEQVDATKAARQKKIAELKKRNEKSIEEPKTQEKTQDKTQDKTQNKTEDRTQNKSTKKKKKNLRGNAGRLSDLSNPMWTDSDASYDEEGNIKNGEHKYLKKEVDFELDHKVLFIILKCAKTVSCEDIKRSGGPR